jgi:hypothetical protein
MLGSARPLGRWRGGVRSPSGPGKASPGDVQAGAARAKAGSQERRGGRHLPGRGGHGPLAGPGDRERPQLPWKCSGVAEP